MQVDLHGRAAEDADKAGTADGKARCPYHQGMLSIIARMPSCDDKMAGAGPM